MKMLKKYSELIVYVFWGGMSTFVSWISYAIFVKMFANFFSENHLVIFSNICSWICAMIFAFIVNKLYVFKSKSWDKNIWILEFKKFFCSRFITGLLEIFLVPLLIVIGLNYALFGIDGMVAKISFNIISHLSIN